MSLDKEYIGFIWVGDDPGVRLSVWAKSGEEAWAKVVEQYGEGHVISLHNADDSRRPR
jgi:hypothetical protein